MIIALLILFALGAAIWFRPSWVQYNDPWERWPANGDTLTLAGFAIMMVAGAGLSWNIYALLS